MMKKIPTTNSHRKKLNEFNLQHIPDDSIASFRFEPGETMSKEDGVINWIFLVFKGRAKVCRTASNGNNHILCYYISDGIIGEIELMTHQNIATSTSIAISDFDCIAVKYGTCINELKSNVKFLNKLGTFLANKVIDNANNLVSISHNSGEQRLCSYIIKNSYKNVFRDVLTDISASVGISYRHMFRILSYLCEREMLEKKEYGYLIVDYDSLNNLASLT